MADLSALFGNTTFKPADVEEVEINFAPLPKGQYRVHITESEVNPNKSGTGTNMTLKLVVQDGKYTNRIIFENLCVKHNNATAQAIAQTRLKQICESLKITQLKDSIQLHDKDLMVSLDVELDIYATEKAGPGSDPIYRNTIKGYSPAPAQAKAKAPVDEVELEDIPF